MMDLYTRTALYFDNVFPKTDSRVDDWFMMSSPVPSAIICISYVALIKLGPTLMKDREALSLRNVMLFYNFAMVILSAYCFIEFGLSGWFTGYTLGCEEVDYSNSPKALRMASVCWVFYMSKFIELLDTIFFVLRKKFNQCSFLHVFHHAVVPISWWFGVKYIAGGVTTFHALLNSFIHFMMYSYYFLSALGPKYQKYLWWKKYMTKMQMTQFVLITVHTVNILSMKDCNFPHLFAYWLLLPSILFFVLFANFYIQAYTKKPHHHRANHDGDKHSTNGSAVTNGKQKKL